MRRNFAYPYLICGVLLDLGIDIDQIGRARPSKSDTFLCVAD